MNTEAIKIIHGLINNVPQLEKSEHIDIAATVLETARRTGKPARIISLTCANYETLEADGVGKVPILHKELIWNERGLRRGYVAAREELPAVLEVMAKNYIPIRHSVVLVDYGMTPQLWGKTAQKYLGLDETQIKNGINNTVDSNVNTLRKLERHGLANRGVDADVVRAVRLTEVAKSLEKHGVDFGGYWAAVTQAMYGLVNEPNHPVAGLIRRALKKDAPYLRQAWGMTSDQEIRTRVIDQTFALTAAVAHLLPEVEATIWDDEPVSRNELIMLDTIPGPANLGHTEFRMYNTHLTEITGEPLPPIPIIRPLKNTVLFSQPAVESSITGKTLEQMAREANIWDTNEK